MKLQWEIGARVLKNTKKTWFWAINTKTNSWDVTFTEGEIPKVGAIFPNPEDVGWLEGEEWKVACIVSDFKRIALLEALAALDSIHSDHGDLAILNALADMFNDCVNLDSALR